jgi:hypothetical protein
MNWKGCGSKWLWPKLWYNSKIFLQRLRKSCKISVRNTGLRTKILTQELPSCFPLTAMFGSCWSFGKMTWGNLIPRYISIFRLSWVKSDVFPAYDFISTMSFSSMCNTTNLRPYIITPITKNAVWVIKLKSIIYWDVTPCNLIKVYQCFGWT